ncbi:hypothetical protein DPMN_157764 [Dreissena polymorpha]|uniref:Uncharacterized protein n=1 Tax=Dreissena polymorpha TaxID=45954 RepID=A0A9D4EKZ6_DREPO|nr:hypothetical protein DPMN_157764 [Dreissena polymorpha]
MFQQKSDELIQLRRATSSIHMYADTDNVRLDSGTDEEFDISAETRKLQDELAHSRTWEKVRVSRLLI